MKNTYTIIAVIILILIGGWYYTNKAEAPEQVVEVNTPEETDPNLTAAVDPKSNISFNYPSELTTKYVSTAKWPPTFVSGEGTYNCDLDENTTALSGFTSRSETFNGTDYCIAEQNEGAAGSTYTNYQVTFYPEENDTYVTMDFTLRYVQCLNYPTAEATICQSEQKNFSPLTLIDEIAHSVIVLQ